MNEVRKTVPAGGQLFVDAACDFIFCSFADRPFRIIIDGQPVTVKVGDKLRPEKRIRNFQLENLDDENPIALTLVVGEGDYNSQIIQGEVTVLSGLRTADGSWLDDSREDLELTLNISKHTPNEYQPGDVIYETAIWPEVGGKKGTVLSDGRMLVCKEDGLKWAVVYGMLQQDAYLVKFEDMGLSELGNAAPVEIGNLLVVADNQERPLDGESDLTFRKYNKFTYAFEGQVSTNVVMPGTAQKLSCVWDSEFRHFYVVDKGTLWVVSEAGQSINEIDLASQIDGVSSLTVRGIAILEGKLVIAQTGNTYSFTRGESPTFIEGSKDDYKLWPNVNTYGLCVTPRGTAIAFASGTDIAEFAYQDVKESFVATVQHCQGGGLLKGDAFPTQAAVNLLPAEGGRFAASGEILRATLDVYTGFQGIRSDYLDYIYKAVFSNEGGLSPRTISAGGSSFKRAGVEDNFSVKYPMSLKITFRRGLFDNE